LHLLYLSCFLKLFVLCLDRKKMIARRVEIKMAKRAAALSRKSAPLFAETLADKAPSDPPRKRTTSSRNQALREDSSPAPT
jgi:hypothetical protein